MMHRFRRRKLICRKQGRCAAVLYALDDAPQSTSFLDGHIARQCLMSEAGTADADAFSLENLGQAARVLKIAAIGQANAPRAAPQPAAMAAR
jgi:hypothetical protein